MNNTTTPAIGDWVRWIDEHQNNAYVVVENKGNGRMRCVGVTQEIETHVNNLAHFKFFSINNDIVVLAKDALDAALYIGQNREFFDFVNDDARIERGGLTIYPLTEQEIAEPTIAETNERGEFLYSTATDRPFFISYLEEAKRMMTRGVVPPLCVNYIFDEKDGAK